jgi:hypothetical protein
MATWTMLEAGERAALEAEMGRELAPGHPLANRRWRAIARGEGDDVAFIVGHTELWRVHLTWQVETSPTWPVAERVLAEPIGSYDRDSVLLALELHDALDEDVVSRHLADLARRRPLVTIKLLRTLRGLSLADTKALLGRLASLGEALHEPGALSRALAWATARDPTR